MAEEFLEEIYERSDLIEQFREILQKVQRMLVEAAEVQWNKAVPRLQEQMDVLKNANPKLALKIMDACGKAHDAWRDPSLFGAVIEGELLPLLFEQAVTDRGIDVTEGRFTLRSTNTGYLTVYDDKNDLFLHSISDPMWEAHILAEVLWKPGMEEFHIFGAGLGYLAYQIWKVSYESTRIIIYETSEDMVSYADAYGVLSRIPEEYLDIYVSSDKAELEQLYHKNISDPNTGAYISTWMGIEYEKEDAGKLAFERMNADACRWFRDLWMINLLKNRKRANISIKELRESLHNEEWVVVAAGPSVDDQIGFLKASAGKIRIVAVDVILKRLLSEGIIPDLVVIGDPKDQMLRHIEGIEDKTENIPCLADRLANWRYLSVYRGPVALMTAQSSVDEFGPAEEPEEGVWNTGGTVASLALETAVRFGAKKVYLAGLDLSYPDNALFAAGTAHEKSNNDAGLCTTEAVCGGMVKTSKTFLFFLGIIERQISVYPEVKFINMSKKGARIRGTVQQ